VLFAEMLLGPFARAFLQPGTVWDVLRSPILIALSVLCIGSVILPSIRRKKSSVYAAAAGAALWIMAGAIIVGAASM